MAAHFLKKGVGRGFEEKSRRKAGAGGARRWISFLLAFAMVFSVAAIGLTGPVKAAQGDAALQFNEKGEFKILQIADVQDNAKNGFMDETLNLINAAIRFSKPDLVVFTGDQIQEPSSLEDAKNSIQIMTNPLVSAGIPFAVVFGNHDASSKASKKQQMEYYMSLPGCVALVNDSDYSGSANDGCGNYYLPVQSSDGTKNAFNLWFFDSLDAAGDRNSHVTQAQIDWFDQKNAELGKIPGIVFQHICVPEIYQLLEGPLAGVTKENVNASAYPEAALCENDNQFYVKKPATTGMLGEGPCPNGYSDYTAGSDQYRSWVAQGNIQGAFFGHDHLNDIVGQTDDGIVLAQCKTIGSGDNYNNNSAANDAGRVPSQALRDQLAGTNGYRTITIYEDPAGQDVLAGTNFKTESFYEKDVIHERYLELTRLEKALALTPQKAQSYYTEASWSHFMQVMAEQARVAEDAAFQAWEAYDEARQNQANAIAASIEAAYNALAAKPAQGDLDAAAAPVLLAPEIVRVGAAENGLAKVEYGNHIQTGELDYSNKTWVENEADRQIKFFKDGATNISLTAPAGVTVSGPVRQEQNGVDYLVWTITGGTATAGETLCFQINYTYQDRAYQSRAYVYVDTVISPSGWYTFTRSSKAGIYANASAFYTNVLHVSTLTGKGVYAANGTGYYNYERNYAMDSSGSGYTGADDNFIGIAEQLDADGSVYQIGRAPDGRSDIGNSAPAGRFYGLRFWSPPKGNDAVLKYWTQWRNRPEKDSGSDNGERAKSDVYVDTSVTSDLSDLGLTFSTWIPANIRSSGNSDYSMVSRGLMIRRGSAAYQTWNEELPVNETGWVHGFQKDSAVLNARGQSFVTRFSGALPKNQETVTLVSQWYDANRSYGVGVWDTLYNRTYNGYELTFHTFDKGLLRSFLEQERAANRQASSYLETGRAHDTGAGAFSRYEAALKEAYRQLYQPDTDQASIDRALDELKKWTMYDPNETDYANGDMIRRFVLELAHPQEDRIEVRYSLSEPQTTGSWLLEPTVYSILDHYQAAQIQLSGSGADGAFVVSRAGEADVSFRVLDNGAQRMPGDLIGGRDGLAKGSYTDYRMALEMLVNDETPAGTYTGKLTLTFTNPPADGSYPSTAPVDVMTIDVVLVVEEGYIITIPADTNIPFFEEHTLLGGAMANLTARVQIPSGESVGLRVASKNGYSLQTDGSAYEIPYRLDEQKQAPDESGNIQMNYDPFSGAEYTMEQPHTKTSLAVSVTADAWRAVPIDTYSDVLTFTASYSGSGNVSPTSARLRNQAAPVGGERQPVALASDLMMRPSILKNDTNTAQQGGPVVSVNAPSETTAAETAAPKEPVTTAPSMADTTPAALPEPTAAPSAATQEPVTAKPASQKETAAIPPAANSAEPEEQAEPVS